MTEDDLMKLVLDLAHVYSWRAAHFRVALTSRGWRTPVSADGKGFPDLILVRDRVIAVELKADIGYISPEQRVWLEAFRDAGVETYVWRPVHWRNGAIVEALRRRAGEPRAPRVREPLPEELTPPQAGPVLRVLE